MKRNKRPTTPDYRILIGIGVILLFIILVFALRSGNDEELVPVDQEVSASKGSANLF